jgi:hypothetical protein
MIAKAICADYERRRTAASRKDTTDEVKRALNDFNAIVDEALLSVQEEGLRKEILRDMIERRGWERSNAQMYICENSYYARRRRVLYQVALGMHLI